ncbi:MAG: hypothetical protein KKF62_11470 [Bacteroidetes bacterium]|nr:hypothetical protein [Bacteroidota bacterium]MBU1799478.1 hypothetical protein [Bacteroidota bacterium]
MSLKNKYQFSENVISKIVINASGFLSPIELDKLIINFENQANNFSFTQSSESNLLRIFNSIFDKGSFFSDCARYPHLVEIVISVASYSNFLTDILVRNPELVYLILKDNFLKDSISKPDLEIEVDNANKRFPQLISFIEFLKFIQRKYILKIGLRDILGIATLAETTADISKLAFVITSSIFEISLVNAFNKIDTLPILNKHMIIALGKMGGNELNYSSDIDLIVFFDKNEKINGNKDYFEILNSAIQIFTQLTSQVTNGGFLYRVDFRLRPDGNFAPLARTLNDSINYYESRGELWEKQMLIKSSFLSGNIGIYDKFIKFRNYFTFNKSFSDSPISQIKEMKYEIEKRDNDNTNIKTFWGGIRDIEFSVQALQLLNGKNIPELRTPNTLDALHHLKFNNIITENEYSVFTDSYTLFRKIEHFLQLMNNSQTHSIPENFEILTKVATYLGFKNVDEFRNNLNKSRNKTREIFNSIFEIDEKEIADTFEKISFFNKNRAFKNIEYLRVGSGLSANKTFDSKTITVFNQIELTLISYLMNSSNPDHVLENFVKLVLAYPFRTTLYLELKNAIFFERVLTICEYSQISIDLLSFDKSLIDMIISRKAFIDIAKYDVNSLEYSQLRFILAVQFSLNLISEKQISELFANYFNFHLANAAKSLNIKYNFFIAGLGSFGIKEMNFFSDVDLIVVVENITNRKIMETDFQNFLKEARIKFPNVEIDFRLRPEGKSSLLVWDINNYKNYLVDRADFWEFQTLMKISFVNGNDSLFTEFRQIILSLFIERYSKIPLLKIREMHDKSTLIYRPSPIFTFDLKKSNGGFLTIDYILHALLHKKIDLAEKLIGKNYIEKLNIFKLEINLDIDTELIKQNYSRLKKILFHIQNYSNSSGYKLKQNIEDKDNLVKSLGYENTSAFTQAIMKMAKDNYMTLIKTLSI